MAVIGRAAHFRDQAGNHVGRAAEAGAGENQRLAADIVMATVRPAQPHAAHGAVGVGEQRSEEHTSELQSLMRISYAVFCLKKKKHNKTITTLTITPRSQSVITH